MTDEKAVAVENMVSARSVLARMWLQAASRNMRLGNHTGVLIDLDEAAREVEVMRKMVVEFTARDQDGVPNSSMICGICGEHESRCQCAETCNVCGVRDCDDLHETDAAGYEPRARA